MQGVQKTLANGGEVVGATVSTSIHVMGIGYLYVSINVQTTHEEITQTNASLASTNAFATFFVNAANIKCDFSQGTLLTANLADSENDEYAATAMSGDILGNGNVEGTSQAGFIDAKSTGVPAQDSLSASNYIVARRLMTAKGNSDIFVQDNGKHVGEHNKLFSLVPKNRRDAKSKLYSVALKPAPLNAVMKAVSDSWKKIFVTV